MKNEFLHLTDPLGGPVKIRRSEVLAIFPSISASGGSAIKYGRDHGDVAEVESEEERAVSLYPPPGDESFEEGLERIRSGHSVRGAFEFKVETATREQVRVIKALKRKAVAESDGPPMTIETARRVVSNGLAYSDRTYRAALDLVKAEGMGDGR